ncbi:MAG: RraA family protein [Pseudomonadota bacterium]
MIESLTTFSQLNACDLADVLPRSQVLDRAIAPLLPTMPRILGPAYTVHCPTGDNLMMHAAIYAAQPGSIIVARSEDGLSAMVGGNVCAMAQQRGIVGLVIDGVVLGTSARFENWVFLSTLADSVRNLPQKSSRVR